MLAPEAMLAGVLAITKPATAASPVVEPSNPPTAKSPTTDPPPTPTPAGPTAERIVEVETPDDAPEHSDRASTVVSRNVIDERQPRSTPDALRYEPGVYVQQTAHAQASPYVRGLTGQQTVLSFDGIRLNNSTFRQGPNQYFFLVDSRTVSLLEILRGAASTRYGSDAIGGALLATPLDPTIDTSRKWSLHPKLMLATRTADTELGGRAQIDASVGGVAGFIGGFGYRDVGQLVTAGPITEPATGEPYKSPRFEADLRTQRGTGFREYTGDARLVIRPDPSLSLTMGYYDYRQKDAPRTDRCPADGAPEHSCLIYLDQFRTLVYAALALHGGAAVAQKVRVTASYQRQHEHRFLFSDNGLPGVDGGVENHGSDNVDTLGAGFVVTTAALPLGAHAELDIEYGGDLYLDFVDSLAWQLWTDSAAPDPRIASRGQYLTDSTYLTSGLFVAPTLHLGERISLRTGGRVAHVRAHAPGDAASSSSPVDQNWLAAIGNGGVVWSATHWLDVSAGADQGFRAPNLDDLTSRQQTGPGFQYENPNLEPERALTLESGVRIHHGRLELEAFGFRTQIDDMIGRAPRTLEECPAGEPGCDGSRTRLQLVNLDGRAVIWGADGSMRIPLPAGLGVRSSISYAWGEGPNPVPPPVNPGQTNYDARTPLSRIPPLNGSFELGWRSAAGVWAGASLRWAAPQSRLAVSDVADIRIPLGGTPGFAVVDARVGYRFSPWLLWAMSFENVLDTPYRYHGSAVNGAGRSINLNVNMGW